jgi:hypothetical protein
MKSGIRSTLLAITLTLGCGGVVLTLAGCDKFTKKPQAEKVKVDSLWGDVSEAMDKRHYLTASKLLRILANKGDKKASDLLSSEFEFTENPKYRDLPIMFGVGQKGVVIDGHIPASTYEDDIRLYRFLAEQGNTKAQYNLSIMYKLGAGVAQDYVRAYMWFTLAAIADDIKFLSSERDTIAANMTPAQIAEAQAMARKCQAANFKKCD